MVTIRLTLAQAETLLAIINNNPNFGCDPSGDLDAIEQEVIRAITEQSQGQTGLLPPTTNKPHSP